MTRSSQLSTYVFIPALLLGLFAAYWSSGSARATGGSSGPPGESGSVSVTSVTSVTSSGGGGNSVTLVSCSGDSCSVTLSGNSQVTVLDATFSLERIENGRATLRVDDQDVSCSAGQTVLVASLNLACTSVTSDTVEFTASPA